MRPANLNFFKDNVVAFRLPFFIFLFILFLVNLSYVCIAQPDRIKIQIPEAGVECANIWQTIKDISFFETNHYSLSLPQNEMITYLLEKSRKDSLLVEDYDSLCTLISRRVYSREDYEKGYQNILQATPLLEKAISILSEIHSKWEFKMFPQYQLDLTLYGPGGSYDPETGRILLMTRPDGSFKGYNNPVNTIIHEMIHIGIEESIVKKYRLSHTLKEQLVDRCVRILFGDMLPDYRIQDFGNNQIDKYLKSKEDFVNLPSVVEKFLREQP